MDDGTPFSRSRAFHIESGTSGKRLQSLTDGPGLSSIQVKVTILLFPSISDWIAFELHAIRVAMPATEHNDAAMSFLVFMITGLKHKVN